MSWFTKFLFSGTLYLSLSFLFPDVNHLSAYVAVPRSTADITDRMNAGGDPPDRPGLMDDQRSPEFLDDWWGRNDYYYSQYGVREFPGIRHPAYDTLHAPFYPFPNTYSENNVNNPNIRYYDYNMRYYRPTYPVGP
jgi:hypothetical protein